MANPLTADAVLNALTREGVRVKQYKDWRDHNREGHGEWGPVHGVMIHHTVTSGTSNSVELCYAGYSGLPGPLCHGVIDKEGYVWLVGWGRANHAGGGDNDVLNAVIEEDYGDKPPATDKHEGESGAVDGNARFYGFECINLGDGKDPWTTAQLDAIERAAAAICRAHGWTAKSVIGHLEWSDWKSDPKGFSMVDMRERIEKRLGTAPAKPPATTPPPAPQYQPFPGTDWFKKQPNSPIVTAMGKRLVAVGCSAYSKGPGPQWTEADRLSYQKWQKKMGFSGSDADGWPGKTSWDALKVPKVV